jgi:hypothetical protein
MIRFFDNRNGYLREAQGVRIFFRTRSGNHRFPPHFGKSEESQFIIILRGGLHHDNDSPPSERTSTMAFCDPSLLCHSDDRIFHVGPV